MPPGGAPLFPAQGRWCGREGALGLFVSVIDKVNQRASLPVFANFDDSAARLSLEANLYGVKDGKQCLSKREGGRPNGKGERGKEAGAGAGGSSDVVHLSDSKEASSGRH